MHLDKIKLKAIELRKQGFSYSEISNSIGIAQGTCSAWLAHITLSPKAKKILLQKGLAGRLKGLNKRNQNIKDKYRAIEQIVSYDLKSLDNSLLTRRLLCSFLYWAEGSKSRNEFKFINSDPMMIKLFLKLFRESFNLDENKFGAIIHIHSYHDKFTQLQFWSKLTKISVNRIGIYHKKNSGKRKRLNYQGCITINYYDVKLYKALTNYYQLYAHSMGA
jgi:hypothetical protein